MDKIVQQFSPLRIKVLNLSQYKYKRFKNNVYNLLYHENKYKGMILLVFNDD